MAHGKEWHIPAARECLQAAKPLAPVGPLPEVHWLPYGQQPESTVGPALKHMCTGYIFMVHNDTDTSLDSLVASPYLRPKATKKLS